MQLKIFYSMNTWFYMMSNGDVYKMYRQELFSKQFIYSCPLILWGYIDRFGKFIINLWKIFVLKNLRIISIVAKHKLSDAILLKFDAAPSSYRVTTV